MISKSISTDNLWSNLRKHIQHSYCYELWYYKISFQLKPVLRLLFILVWVSFHCRFMKCLTMSPLQLDVRQVRQSPVYRWPSWPPCVLEGTLFGVWQFMDHSVTFIDFYLNWARNMVMGVLGSVGVPVNWHCKYPSKHTKLRKCMYGLLMFPTDIHQFP